MVLPKTIPITLVSEPYLIGNFTDMIYLHKQITRIENNKELLGIEKYYLEEYLGENYLVCELSEKYGTN